MEQPKEYYAFISYKREDEKWAKWLQDKLEHYKFPTNLNGRTDLPKNIRPTIRDITDFNPGLLAEEINNALTNSEWLIVVCSPRSAKSPWVCKEAQTFIDLGRADHIIPFVIEGNPFSNDATAECYPEALLNLTGSKELLAANINEMGRDAAAIKVVARMFNLRFDALWQRCQREQKMRRRQVIAAIVLIFLFLVGIAGRMWHQNVLLKEKDWKMMRNQSRAVAEKALTLVDEGDSYLARRILMKVLPNDSTEYPITIEAESALRKACWNEGTVLRGHRKEVRSVSLSPDGKYIVSISDDNSGKIWDVVTGTCIDSLDGYIDCGWQAAVSYSSDGKYIVNKEIIYDAQTGNIYKQFKDYSIVGVMKCSSFSNNGNTIVSAIGRQNYIWNAKTGKIIKSFEGHSGDVLTVSFSFDDKLLVSGSTDKTIRIWDVETRRCLRILQGHTCDIKRVSFSHDNNFIVSASCDNTIRIWDVKTGECLDSLDGHSGPVLDASFSHDDRMIVSASSDKTVRVWNFGTRKCERVLNGHTDLVLCATFSPDDKKIVSSSYDKTIRIWDIETDKSIKQIKHRYISNKKTCSKCFGNYVIALGWNEVYVINKNCHVDTLAIGTYGVRTIDIHPNGRLLVMASRDSTVSLIDIKGRNRDHIIKLSGPVEFTSFSSDGKYVLISQENKKIHIFDVKKRKIVNTLERCFISCDSKLKRILSYSYDTIYVVDVDKNRVLCPITNQFDSFESASFDNLGKKIVSTPWFDYNVYIWDAETGEKIKTLVGHTQHVNFASFSSDGKYIVTASNDNTIRVWDVESGRCIHILKGQSFQYYAVFSVDGKLILSASGDEIEIWEFPPLQQLINDTRERFKNSPLTSEECRQYYLE